MDLAFIILWVWFWWMPESVGKHLAHIMKYYNQYKGTKFD